MAKVEVVITEAWPFSIVRNSNISVLITRGHNYLKTYFYIWYFPDSPFDVPYYWKHCVAYSFHTREGLICFQVQSYVWLPQVCAGQLIQLRCSNTLAFSSLSLCI